MTTLGIGTIGPAVGVLQRALLAHGFAPGLIDNDFGPGTEAAVVAFQRSESLDPDGLVGPLTMAALGLGITGEWIDEASHRKPVELRSINAVSKMIPDAPLRNIATYLPAILAALTEFHVDDDPMFLAAIATIAAEVPAFAPVDEGQSHWNTSPGGHPFDLYDSRRDLGNRGAPDGASFKGRGFVQLTGRANYTEYDATLKMGGALIARPESANGAITAPRLLAAFLAAHADVIRVALLAGDMATARKAVNGGSHGLAAFTEAYQRGLALGPA